MKKNTIKKIGMVVSLATILIACGSDGGSTTSTTPPASLKANLYAWGNNESGQLGIGIETVGENEVLVNKFAPVVVGDNLWKQVSVGISHTVAIDNSDKLYAWGNNGSGQLGIGVETVGEGEVLVNKNTPVPIDPTKTWGQVSVGDGYSVAIDSAGALYTWGLNSLGQLGNGNTDQQNTPVAIEPTKTWKQVNAGLTHTAAIDSDDHLFTWGKNEFGQLGDGNSGTGVHTTAPVQIGTKTWKQVSSGKFHTVAIDSDGALYAWGANGVGQLGIGTETIEGDEVLVDKNAPVQVVIATDTTKTWDKVSAGEHHTVAIDSGGTLYVWGWNTVGQLGMGGDSKIKIQNTPVMIEPTKTWNQVIAGYVSTMAIDSDNHLFAWGLNIYGELGLGNGVTQELSPIAVGTRQWAFVDTRGGQVAAILK